MKNKERKKEHKMKGNIWKKQKKKWSKQDGIE